MGHFILITAAIIAALALLPAAIRVLFAIIGGLRGDNPWDYD